MHEESLGLLERFTPRFVAWMRPVGIRSQAGEEGTEDHAACLVVHFPRHIGHRNVQGKAGGPAETIQSGLVQVHNDRNNNVVALKLRVLLDLQKETENTSSINLLE